MERIRTAFVAALLVLAALWPVQGQTSGGIRWIPTWTTAVVGRPATLPPAAPAANAAPAPPPVTPNNQTLRQIVRSTIAGNRARVVFSNAFGNTPLAIGAASIGVRDTETAIVPQSVRAVTMGGMKAFRIPAGAIVVSDPVDLAVPPMTDLAIDLFIPDDLGKGDSPITMHNGANQTSYASSPGNHAGEASLMGSTATRSWFLISRVEVATTSPAGAIATFGDSITDGTRSTPDTNSRWPDRLARRLAARGTGSPFSVLNVGIAGNRLLSEGNFGAGINALARFERDVLAQPGITHVIVMEGINDIGVAGRNAAPSADDLIAAHRQMIERAHARGITIVGATLTPFEGAAYFTPEGETKRQAVNQWIRTSGAYDAVIDFDRVTRDPAAPTKLLPAYDSGDHLHPGDAGYQAMGDAIDLSLFRLQGS